MSADMSAPVVFIVDDDDASLRAALASLPGSCGFQAVACASGAEFRAKLFREQDLLDAGAAALARDGERRASARAADELAARYAGLTPRERKIMGLAASGLMNKQTAGQIGTSEIPVKIHRANAMGKMQAKTFADLVRVAEALGLDVAQARPGSYTVPSNLREAIHSQLCC